MAERSVVETHLEEAKAAGWVGSLRSLSWQVAHALEVADIVDLASARVVDLGSGGGLPALPLLERYRPSAFVLVEMQQARAALLRRAVRALDLGAGVQVIEERAEVVARRTEWREWSTVVLARSFGSPATTAEVGTALLAGGGVLVVSDVEAEGRWPSDGLDRLGLERTCDHAGARGRWMVATKVGPTPSWAPRSTKAMAERPVW